MINAPYNIFPLGDSAITIDFGNVIDQSLNKKVISLADIIRHLKLVGVRDIIPAYSSVTLHYDVVSLKQHYPEVSAFSALKDKLASLLAQFEEIEQYGSRLLKIPVCYSRKYALDHDEVTRITNLSFDEIVRLHTAKKYRVYMVGFLPGFAYMGEVDERIAVPRKSEPRLKIDQGLVGIAGKQTGIYPLTSPGGWQIIGRTPLKLFDKTREDPVLFRAGDEVEFFSITVDEFENY